jgi:predicted amidohydrolase YtcJ
MIDLEGGTLVPAFCDAHAHLPATGIFAAGMDFRGATSADEILGAFERRARTGEGLLFGGNFEDPLDRPLTRDDLDRAVGEKPAMLARADLHSCIVSSVLLEALDVTDQTGADRDAQGRLTGYLREHAANVAWSWFDTSLPRSDMVAAIREAARLAYSKGIGTVHEMFVVDWRGWASYDVFTEAIEPVSLNVVPYLGTDEIDKVVGLGMNHIGGDYFLDGSFGSHTAWMKEAFTSTPPAGSPACGIRYRDDDELFDFFMSAQAARLQVGVHAIGDAAIEQGIMTWEKVADRVGDHAVRSLSHRIEHFECASDEHIRRAAALGLKASVQPAFDLYWGGADGLYSERIGWERASQMNRFGSMQAQRLDIGGGSDSTVTPLDPFLQMKALRMHHVEDERLSGEAALFTMTAGGHSLGRDPLRGTIEGDGVADLAWLDRDPAEVDPDELEKTEVLGTWVAGKRVWPPEEAEAE